MNTESQFVKDVGRLKPEEGGTLQKIMVDAKEYEVVLDDSLQLIGVSPSDVETFEIEAILGNYGVSRNYQRAMELLQVNGLKATWLPMEISTKEVNETVGAIFDFLNAFMP